MRNLIKDVGEKFHIRIYIYTTAFAIFVFVNISFLVLYFYGYPIMYLPTHSDFFLSQILIVIVMTIVLAVQLTPLAYINEETETQIANFNEIRHFLHRMISDQEMLMMTAGDLPNEWKEEQEAEKEKETFLEASTRIEEVN